MDKETAEALEGSIKKWERIVEGSGVDQGARNCPLCYLFLSDYKGRCNPMSWLIEECVGCPVAEKIGYPGCANTPYGNFRQYFNEYYPAVNHYTYKDAHVFDQESKRLAMVEFEFLKSLREQ